MKNMKIGANKKPNIVVMIHVNINPGKKTNSIPMDNIIHKDNMNAQNLYFLAVHVSVNNPNFGFPISI